MKQKKFFSRRTTRLKGYDYSKPGIYYVTICTKNLEFLFGEIVRGVMYPSAGGLFVIQCWNDIPKHYQRVKLYEFTLMPNHIHGILEITDSEENVVEKEGNNNVAKVEGFGRAQDIEPLPNPQLLGIYQSKYHKTRRKNEFQHIIPGSLGSIIRGFEIGVTKWFRQNTNVTDVWHRNYYESIIRTEKSYYRITKYIRNNQRNWTRDKFNSRD